MLSKHLEKFLAGLCRRVERLQASLDEIKGGFLSTRSVRHFFFLPKAKRATKVHEIEKLARRP